MRAIAEADGAARIALVGASLGEVRRVMVEGDIRYLEGWQRAEPPAEPTGGTIADAEARAAIGELIEVLRVAGVFASA